MIKPRIRKAYVGDHWICIGQTCIGSGGTPKAAYDKWLWAFKKEYYGIE